MVDDHLKMWKCTDCGRKFAKRNQWHSCVSKNINDHFPVGNSLTKNIFDELVKRIKTFGPLRIDAVKTSINLINKHHFGSIQVQKHSLRLGFLSDKKIESDRILHTQRLSANRIDHSMKLFSQDDIDAELIEWLKTAYLLQA